MSNNNSQIKQKDQITVVMKDLEQKINPKNLEEGLAKIEYSLSTKDTSFLLLPMKNGAKEFEERVGRPMTYSEMQEMWG